MHGPVRQRNRLLIIASTYILTCCLLLLLLLPLPLLLHRPQAVLTNAWACAEEKPLVDHCIDSWTDIPLKVPVAGLLPYPAEGAEDPESNMFVTVTPVAMTTLGDTSSSTIKSKYTTAFTKLAVQMPSTANPVHAGGLKLSHTVVWQRLVIVLHL
jgi:hypothetical protein